MKVLIKRDVFESVLYRRGITNKEFAENIGITSNTMSYILNGKRAPSQKTAKKIVEALDLNFEDVFEIKKV